MARKARFWVLMLVAFGAGAATVGVGGMFLRERSSRGATLYTPGVELCRVEGVSIRRYSPLRTDYPEPATTLSWGSMRLPDIIARLESIPRGQLKQEESLPAGYFELQVPEAKGSSAELERRMRLALEDTFGINWTREKEPQQAYVLRSLTGKAPGFDPGTGSVRGSFGSRDGEAVLRFEGNTLAHLADNLSDELEIPVFDETGVSGTWDGELTWRSAEPDGLRRALRAKGLDLSLEVREIDVIIVRRK